MLALALQAIDRAYNPPDDVRIFCDTNTNIDEVEYVRDTYLPHATMFHAPAHADVPSGMWNILNSIVQGYYTGAERVYLIEEDVVIDQNFFGWHRLWQDDILATCGRLGKRRSKPGYYTNPGSCLRRSALDLIVPHVNDELFKDRVAYLNNHFPNSDELSDLDDGLIRRVQKKHGLKVIYPENVGTMCGDSYVPGTPVCSHIGFGGYNHYMNWVNRGNNIQDKILELRKMLTTLDPDGRYTGDFEPIPGDWWKA
jgi:hypothetical protein